MCSNIKQVLVIYKKGNEKAHELGIEISQWLKIQAFKCILIQAGSDYNTFLYKPDFAIVLGGDGTILEVARYYIGTKTIILGINFGRVGFLAAAEPANWKEILIKAFANPSLVQKCVALNWQLYEQELVLRGAAVNDLVISHGKMARLVNLELMIEQESMGCVRSDGLIFFSPLGSSGYNYSAGGPLIHPTINVIGLTPICSFMSSSASLVFPANTTFHVKVTEDSPECYLTVDGQLNFPVGPGNILHIKGQTNAIYLWGNEQKYINRLAEV